MMRPHLFHNLAWAVGVGAWIASTPMARTAPTGGPSLRSVMTSDLSASARIVTGAYTGPLGSRAWRLAVPSSHRPTDARPMLVMLHGCLQDAADIARGTRFDEIAESAGVLVLYPEQPVSANPRKCWNWFDAAHQQREAGEPGLLASLIADVAATQGADPARVHLAGVSAGAAMATLLAVAYPERFLSLTSMAGIGWAAAPSVVTALPVMQQGAGDALPSAERLIGAMGTRARALRVIVVHGTADPVVSFRNATELSGQFVGVHNALRARRGDGPLVARERPDEISDGYTVRELQWYDETGQAMVALVRIEGLGHAWPFGAPAGSFTDAKGPNLARRIGELVAHTPRRE